MQLTADPVIVRSLAIACVVGIPLAFGSAYAAPPDPRCAAYAEAINNLIHETRSARQYEDPQSVIAAQNSGMHWANVELGMFGDDATGRVFATPEFRLTVERAVAAENEVFEARTDGMFAAMVALHRYSDAMVAIHESAYVALCGSAD